MSALNNEMSWLETWVDWRLKIIILFPSMSQQSRAADVVEDGERTGQD